MAANVATVDNAPRAGRREWIGLAVLGLPTMLVAADISVLILALPRLSAELGANSTQQLWITDIYGFLIAGFLVTMGTLCDRIGRRKLLLIGAASFSIASLLAAFSVNPAMLIGARALLGIAGATLLPSTLAMVGSMFKDPKQMMAAMAAWGTAFMSGVTLGPVIGGVLLEYFWWGSVFLLALPAMALLLAAGPAVLPESRAPAAGRLDLTSVALSLAAILPVIYGLKELARDGWGPVAVASIVIGVAVSVVFVARQRRLANPLLDLSLFGQRTLTAGVVIGLVVGALQSGTGLFATIFMQTVEGLSPLRAGLWMIAPNLALIVGINITPALARRIRPGYVLAGGMVISAVGQLLLTQVDSADGMAVLVTGVCIAFFGVGPAPALLTQLVLQSAPPEKAGSASSLSATGGELGIAMGIAGLGSVGAAVYHSQLTLPADVPAAAAESVRDSIHGALAAAAELPAPLGTAVLDLARDGFTAGLHAVAAVGVVAFVGLAALAAALLKHLPPIGATPHDEQAESDAQEAELPETTAPVQH